MIKKRELADVILVNICLFLSLKEIYHMFTYTKKQTKFEKYTVADTLNPWTIRFLCETDVLAKILNAAFVNIAKCVNKFLEYYFITFS